MEGVELNSTLIGGMVSAFSTFLNEVGKQELFGFEIMEREGVSITSHQGKISNIILISTQKLPYNVLDQIKEAQKIIEKKHKNYFGSNVRGVLNLTKSQVRPLFDEADFKLSMLGTYTLHPTNMKKLLKESSISSSMKNNIKSLLDFDKYYDDGRQMSFETVHDYFEERDMPMKMTSRAILLAYRYKILVPEGNGDTDSKLGTPPISTSTPSVAASTPSVAASTPSVAASTPSVVASTPSSSDSESEPQVVESQPLTWKEKKIRERLRIKKEREKNRESGEN
jgi:hypothetical protein